MNCPLCASEDHVLYSQDEKREYFLCQSCTLVFVPRASLITPESELARYDTHNNDEHDEGYRAYIRRTVTEIKPFITTGERALDFGSGRTNLLSKFLITEGIFSDSYDLYYFPTEEIWSKSYDVIVLSEVIEHLREPLQTMERLKSLLNPKGRFFIKTKLRPPDRESFDRWFYKKDPTHVEFFTETAFETLSQMLKMERPRFLGHDVVIVRASH